MTKKIFAMFLAVLMVVSMLPTSVFAAEACPGATATHSLKNCTDYTAVYVKDPNCGEQGYTVYQCNKCSATFVDSWTAPVGEHTWGPGQDKAPTCVESGLKGGEQCSVCKERKNAETVPALGKELMDQGYTVACEWGEWDITEIDCTKKTVQTRYCLNCGAKNEKKHEPAQGATHGDWTDWEVLTAPTADQPGQVIRYCSHEGETWTCTGYEIVELHETHKHEDQVMLLVPEVPAADCASTGVKAHYVCRLCNGLFEKKGTDDYKAITADKLVIESHHTTIEKTLTCQNTNDNCDVCGAVIQLDATKAHDMKGWEIVTGFAPNCEINGFEQNKCKNCVYTETRVINALGHQTVTVSVPATCTAFAYSYTYCTRPDCTYGKNVAAADLKLPESHKFEQYGMVKYVIAAIDAVPAADKAFFLTMVQTNPFVMENLYFNGEMADKALATTHDYRDAAEIYVEAVTGGYLLYMLEGETKIYIEIFAKDNKVNVQLTEEPENVYTWDATNKIFTTKLGEKFYFLGAAGKDTVISAVELKAENTAFMAKLSAADNALVTTKVLSFTVNKDAGVNASAHKLETITYVAPTCQVAGTKIERCTLCGKVMDAVEQPVVDHKWIADTSKTDKAADCTTAGKKYLKCEFCGLTKEEAVPATGHKLVKNEDGTVKKFEHLGNHKDLLAYDYNVCENANCPDHDATLGNRVNKTNFRAWAGAGAIYADPAKAQADHPDCTLTAKTELNVAGDCETVGYTAYTCSGCENIVRVKVDGTGDHVGKNIVPADCENPSYFLTFECTRCHEVIGEGTVAEGKKNIVAPALGHDWVENEEYEFAGCDNLEANEIKHCKRTGCGKVVMDKTDFAHVVVGANLCVGFSYDTFKCNVCNEDHMINFVGPLGHEWKEVAGSKTPASCMAPGHVDLVCKYCNVAADTVEGGAALEIIPQLKHKNADGVEFTANCLTKNEHCVLCCQCVDEDGELLVAGHNCMELKDGEFKNDCRCHFKAEQHNYTIMLGKPDCDTLPYYYMYCDLCHKTTAAQSVSEIEIDANTTHEIVVGHRPAAAGSNKFINRVYKDYGPYTNADATGYWSYTIEKDGEDAVKVTRVWNAKYLAEYIAYKAPTRTEAGYEEYVCADCGETIRNELKVADELEFIAEFQEGDYTYGSLVKVDIFANGADKEIFAFEFNANFTGMVFVGFDENNTEFVVDTTDPAAGQTMITVNGTAYSANVANKEINGKTWLTTLYFRVNVKDASELTVTLSKKLNADGKHEAATKVEIVDGKLSTTVFEPVFAATPAKAKTVAYMDLNGDNKFTFHDVLTGIAMLNLDVEKLYDVAGDIDQDGKFTIADLDMIQDVRLGNATAEELVLNAVSEEEAILMGLLTKCADCETVFEGAECPNKANHK